MKILEFTFTHQNCTQCLLLAR